MTGYFRALGAQPATTTPVPPVTVRVAAITAVFAGLLHFAVVPEHRSEWWAYGVFFTILGAFQIVWAAWVWVDQSRWSMLLGFLVNAAVLALWATTRTTGLPFGPDAGTPESVGVVDVAGGVAELLAMIALARHRPAGPPAADTGEQPAETSTGPLTTVTPEPAP